MVDNFEQDATLVDSSQGSQGADAKIQVVENKLRQISQLIEPIKSGSKRTEEILRKEIDTLRSKQDKLDRTLEIGDLKKTLDKLAPALKTQAQTLSNQISTTNTGQGRTPSLGTGPLQNFIQQFSNNQNISRSFGGMNMSSGGMGASASAQLPNIFSLMQGFMQPGNRNMQNLFPSLLQGFLSGGRMGHMPNMGRMPFGGFGGFGGGMNIPGMGRMPRVRGTGRTREYDGSGDSGKGDDSYTSPSSPSGQIATPIPSGKPSIGGYGEQGKTSSVSPSGTPKEPSKTATRVTGKSFGWWTPQRQQHAVDRLMKEGKLSEMGARGLVSRWAHVEASQGPSEVNSIGATGIGQWLGARKNNLPSDFDGQITHAINELNTSEKRAGNVLRSATSSEEGARGASMYERAEGYDPSTGRDNFTDRTLKYIPSISGTGNAEHILKAPSLAGQEPEKKSIEAGQKAFMTGQKQFPGAETGRETAEKLGITPRYNQATNLGIEYGGQRTTISTQSGAKINVSKKMAPQFKGFLNELESKGYYIDPKTSGGYNDRSMLGGRPSQHAFANAIDINPFEKGNQFNARGTNDLPPDVGQTANKWGISWGGYFQGKKDTMHFEGARTLSAEELKTNFDQLKNISKPSTEKMKDIKDQSRLMSEGKPDIITKPSTGKIEYSRLTSKGTEEDTTPKKEYTSKDVVKQLKQYQNNLDDLLKKQEEKQKPITTEKIQDRLIPPMAPKEPQDLRPNQLKDFAMEEKIQSKVPAKPESTISPGEQKTQDRIAPKSISDILTRNKPEQHESASVKPSWKDEYTIPSKAGNSRVEKAYVKPSTGTDSNFDSASAAASQ